MNEDNTWVLRRLFGILTTRERWAALALALLAIAGAIAETASIGAVFPLMALINSPEATMAHPAAAWVAERLGSPGVDRLVLITACALMLLYVLKNLFLVFLYGFQSRFVANLESRLGIDLVTAYLRAPFTERLAQSSTDRIRIVTTEVGRVTIGVTLSLIGLFSEGLVVVAITVLLLAADPLVASVAMAVIGIVALLMQTIFRRKLDAHRAARVTTLSGMFRWVNEGIGALREIKVLGREDHVVGEFSRNSRRYAHGTYLFTTLNLLPRVIFETAAISALLLAVIMTVLLGKPLQGVVPALSVFALAAVRLLPSASRIIGSLNTLRYYMPAVETVARDLAQRPGAESAPPPQDARAREARRFELLELSRVSYRYPGSAVHTLNDIDLRIERGDSLAILGRSGSGKTTLADLLLGLLDPGQGTISVNGSPVRSLRDPPRLLAGLVPQDIYLIDDTVRRNVAFGLPDGDIDDARIWKCLQLARLEDRVRALPEGLESLVGERGATLSGGERQRVGIARALYTDPEILMLDEASSGLDEATEAEFARTLQSLRGEKTIITITHRLRSAAWCDRAVVMKQGRIVAHGTFGEVIRTGALGDAGIAWDVESYA